MSGKTNENRSVQSEYKWKPKQKRMNSWVKRANVIQSSQSHDGKPSICMFLYTRLMKPSVPQTTDTQDNDTCKNKKHIKPMQTISPSPPLPENPY